MYGRTCIATWETTCLIPGTNRSVYDGRIARSFFRENANDKTTDGGQTKTKTKSNYRLSRVDENGGKEKTIFSLRVFLLAPHENEILFSSTPVKARLLFRTFAFNVAVNTGGAIRLFFWKIFVICRHGRRLLCEHCGAHVFRKSSSPVVHGGRPKRYWFTPAPLDLRAVVTRSWVVNKILKFM